MTNDNEATQFEGSVEKPLNREPSPDALISDFITDKDVYDRNHGPIPHINASTHLIRLDGAVRYPLSLSIAYLSSLPQHTITSALQCAGNRRHTMRTKIKEVWGIDWHNGAVMNATWTGPLLSDVLAIAEPTLSYSSSPTSSSSKEENTEGRGLESSHVAFSCHQTPTQSDGYYGGSIPLSRAMDPASSVLLALQMNGKPLTPSRGYPVRVIVPGVAGARAVKWLDRITVQSQESSNVYQQKDYKILPPEVQTKEEAEIWWHRLPAILEMPVNSVIVSPLPDSTLPSQPTQSDPLVISGYALPHGSDGPVTSVEVSTDDGESWTAAEILLDGDGNPPSKWSWALWRFEYTGKVWEGLKILSRARDKGGNVQKREDGGRWNLRGVAYNGFGEVSGLRVE